MGRPQKRSYRTGIAIFLCLAGSLCGCEGTTPSSQKVIADLQKAITEAQTRLDELAPSGAEVQKAAATEVGKLYAIEYKVVTVPPDASALDLERQLSTLGAERWDCGQPFSGGGETQILCRRIPLSYLKLIAQLTRMM